MSAEGGQGGGRGEAGIGTLNPVGSISSPTAEHSSALDVINGKSGGSRIGTPTPDLFGMQEYHFSGPINYDSAAPIIKGSSEGILQETALLNAEDRVTDKIVSAANLEDLKTKYETLIAGNESLTAQPEIDPIVKTETSSPNTPDVQHQKEKKLFDLYIGQHILPKLKEDVQSKAHPEEKEAEEENTTVKIDDVGTEQVLEVIDGRIQLRLITPKEETEEEKREKLQLTVKDQVEILADVNQAIKV